MKRGDSLAALLFLALAAGLAVGARALPAGVGSVPGPGFFPAVIAAVLAVLALALWRRSRRAPAAVESPGRLRQTLGAAAIVFVYLLLWGTGLFPLRTAVFLALLLRFLGESWKASAGVAVLLTTVVFFAFQVGLRVSLE